MDDKALELFDKNKPVELSREDRLLETVLASGNIEVLERFIALRKSEEERQARIDFEQHFSEMRKELPRITKSKDVAIRGTKAYSYAPLESIQGICDPIIFKHGLTYSWREEAIAEGKRVWLDITGFGHTRSNYFDSPRIDPITSREGNAVTNVIQAAGVMSTYGKRYTFVSGFGIIIEGEDTDAANLDGGSIELDLREYIRSGKLLPDAVKIIEKELNKPEAERNIETLRNYWKRAKAKCEK